MTGESADAGPTLAQLRAAVARLEDAEKLQRALYAIADMAGSDLEMPDMLRGLHRIVSDLMYAENFYIALYDQANDSLRFLYFADAVDTEVAPSPDEDIPLSRIERGLSWYLIRQKKPLMGTPEELKHQVSGPLKLIGADSADWLGVPMMREGEVRGIVVVQSYLEGRFYTGAERSLLAFVAEHILTALERKAMQADLERRVAERTQQLYEANAALRQQVAERERGERLQAALYRIAALAGSTEDSNRFFAEVHETVGGLIDARNFYVALLSDDGRTVEFPYAVDEHDTGLGPRPLGHGLTEYVLRTGEPQLVDVDRARELEARGEISPGMVDARTRVWLGVPLYDEGSPIGVVAVQSYDSEGAFDARDVELLTFVSHQLSSSLQRRRAAELLREANAELEARVEQRTAELREQIAVREQVEAQLQHQVMHDALTGLPNRSYLRDRIERALSRVRRNQGEQFALLYVDVDRFKVINDSLGHGSGDSVLKEVGRRLSACVRNPDVVSRLAGDEFAVLIEHVPMPQSACNVARRILSALEAPVPVATRGLKVSASVGIAIVDHRYASTDQVLHDADLALYRAKSAGRDRFVLFDEAMQRSAMDVLELEQSLRGALERDEFEPHFQPLVRLADGEIVGYEALLRWCHPERGLLPPGAFLTVAEDSGLVEAIDWRMFRLALECGRGLVPGDRYLTINVSPRMFQVERFDQRLLSMLDDVGFEPARLRVEVTEGTLLADPAKVLQMLASLHEAGVEAALDDFGTGQSSLGQVHRFPVCMIKIDRSFVAPFEAGTDRPRSSAVIEAILALGRALDMEIVAEGVETEVQRKLLVSMGCDYGQGFLFGRPQPAAHWLELDAAARGRA